MDYTEIINRFMYDNQRYDTATNKKTDEHTHSDKKDKLLEENRDKICSYIVTRIKEGLSDANRKPYNMVLSVNEKFVHAMTNNTGIKLESETPITSSDITSLIAKKCKLPKGTKVQKNRVNYYQTYQNIEKVYDDAHKSIDRIFENCE
jgi:hypothetical protein